MDIYTIDFNGDLIQTEITLSEPEQITLFKIYCMQALINLCLKASLFSAEDVEFSPDWKDWLAQASIGGTTIVSTGLLTILISAGFIAAIPGLTIPIGLAGLALGIGYNQYRTNQKKEAYHRVGLLFEGRNTQEIRINLEKIKNNLAQLYAINLAQLRPEKAQKMAHVLTDCVIKGIKKGRLHDLNDLLDTSILMHFLVSEKKHIKNIRFNRLKRQKKKWSTRSASYKPGIFINESGRVYQTTFSRPTKYGFICFESQADFLRFRELELAQNRYYTKLSEEESVRLTHSFFNNNSSGKSSPRPVVVDTVDIHQESSLDLH